MDLNLQSMSEEEKQRLYEHVRSRRQRTADPLLVIAMKDLVRSVSRTLNEQQTFVDEKRNPFGTLPDNLVQKLLALITESRREGVPLVPKDSELVLVRLLLNHNVREFDCSRFDPQCRSHDLTLFWMLLELCPNLERFRMSIAPSSMWSACEELPVERVAAWTRLTHLYLRGHVCVDSTLQQISQLLQNLESLEFDMTGSGVTEDGVNSLALMQKLKGLSVNVLYQEGAPSAVDVLVDIAGRVSSLQTFSFDAGDEGAHCDFVELYGERYPQKKLLLTKVRLTREIKRWPSCLSVQTLQVEWGLPASAVKTTIRSIPLPMPYLHFNHVAAPIVYDALETLGAQLETLTIGCLPFHSTEELQQLDLHHLITSCPNIHTFNMYVGVPYQPGSTENLTPQHFAKMKRICVGYDMDKGFRINDLVKIWTLFLLGTQCPPDELCMNVDDLIARAVRCALAIDPDCLSNLQRVLIDVVGDPVEDVLELATLMILNAPRLVQVSMSYISNLDEHHSWFRQLVNATGVCLSLNGRSEDYGGSIDDSDQSSLGEDDDDVINNSDDDNEDAPSEDEEREDHNPPDMAGVQCVTN